MGYSIYIRERITPQFTAVHGPHGLETRLNPGPPPAYPATFGGRIYADLSDLYGSDPTRRVELWEDSAGTAASADIFAACPLLRQWRESQIRAEGARRLNELARPYEPAERETWGYQKEEALAWQQNPATPTPFCDAVAAGRGVPRELFMTKVLENYTLFYQAAANILGQQQALIDRVNALEDVAAVLAVTWP